MPTRTLLVDEHENELECYLNDKGKVFISIGEREADITQTGFITLNKEDVTLLIKMLSDLKKDMTEENFPASSGS